VLINDVFVINSRAFLVDTLLLTGRNFYNDGPGNALDPEVQLEILLGEVCDK
jgi:hypothetical protein